MDFLEDLFEGFIGKKKYGHGKYGEQREYHDDHNHNHKNVYDHYENKNHYGASCPKCSAMLVPGARFCGNCGANMSGPRSCVSCGAQLPATANFCQSCGTKA